MPQLFVSLLTNAAWLLGQFQHVLFQPQGQMFWSLYVAWWKMIWKKVFICNREQADLVMVPEIDEVSQISFITTDMICPLIQQSSISTFRNSILILFIWWALCFGNFTLWRVKEMEHQEVRAVTSETSPIPKKGLQSLPHPPWWPCQQLFVMTAAAKSICKLASSINKLTSWRRAGLQNIYMASTDLFAFLSLTRWVLYNW